MNSSNLSVFHQSPKVSKKPDKSNVKTNNTIFVTNMESAWNFLKIWFMI